MKIRIDVMLKEGVLDPQGKAIGHALGAFGFKGIEDIRAGKVFMLDVAETDPAKAKAMAEDMAQKILANMVIEEYKVTVV